MAGSWPDLPGRKMAYHDDGTVVAGRYPIEGAPYENFYEWSQSGINELNDLDFVPIGVTWSSRLFPAMGRINDLLDKRVETVWLFPEFRDIEGFVGTFTETGTATQDSDVTIQISGDTTNGIDGSWTNIVTWNTDSNMLRDVAPEGWRTGIVVYSFPNARGLKAKGQGNNFSPTPLNWRSMFIFGHFSAGETPDRILFIDDNTGLEFLKPMDWGDVPRGTTLEWDIYLFNNSSTLTANTMVLDFTTLYNDSDTWYSINEGGGSFSDTLNVASIANGARYPLSPDVLTVKLIVPDEEPLGIYEAILELSTAVSWT